MNLAAEALTRTNRDAASGHRIGEIFTLVDDADRRPLGAQGHGRRLAEQRQLATRVVEIKADEDDLKKVGDLLAILEDNG